ncbi:M14 family metallopeptidase [Robiginitalea aurantiaca]|uniref:M14 family metallopeptidase n=1 Tax=Robiginitalea aurantiaca TaxID=3056915 RepID=A0ABT7WI73_9FLAO|nr:M14 family metallopeptidase [Robiginitalea aurantiaca]MDM9632626.1 M14 family metallopeptidase [Robiginitalea aurantiaca]
MRIFSALFVFLILNQAVAQDLKSPSEYLGYELGSKFTRHHEVVSYFQYVSNTLPQQVQLQPYGYTNERRPLMLAMISSAENMAKLDEVRKEHLQSTEGAGSSEIAVVWLSYNVHGNESVSTEASMQTIYELLTSKKDYLENTVVIIDPCINPDGRDRYVNWYYQYKNNPYQVDADSKEHREGWWSGRSNHYMFDLNRDWAWLTQVESQQRLKQFNQWIPHIHVDFHEQGMNSPYYFAPAAEPYHEVITDFQRDFQVKIGKNHARYFDQNGWFYFTREVFDLFYPSYGDTYPTYNGAIGMTYEQGGSGRAGLGVVVDNGDTLTLKDRIAHHLTTGLSTVEVASQNAGELNEEFRTFYKSGKDFKYNSYILNGDADKQQALADLLDKHQISYGWADGSSVRGTAFGTGESINLKTTPGSMVVSTNQKKGTMVKVLFEPNAVLSDSLTYDITAWSLPYAYGMDAVASESLARVNSSQSAPWDAENLAIQKGAFAHLGDWNSMKDARFLSDLLQKGIRVRRSERPFELNGQNWAGGSLIITRADNKNVPDFESLLQTLVEKHRKPLTPASTGLVDSGKDFGSGYVGMIPAPKVAVLSGEPTSTLRFGEVWHFFEQQLYYPISVLDADYFDRIDLGKYDVLVLPGGWGYSNFLNETRKGKLKDWVASGGRLVAMGSALGHLGGEDGFSIKRKEAEETDLELEKAPDFAGTSRERIRDEITGAIFKTEVDPTHPLAFGYGKSYYTLKLGSNNYTLPGSGTVAALGESPIPVAGFAGSKAIQNLPNSLVFAMEYHGSGQVVYMADNPLFRGFWENGKLFFANAVFMAD